MNMSTLQRNERTSLLALGIYLALFAFAVACHIRLF